MTVWPAAETSGDERWVEEESWQAETPVLVAFFCFESSLVSSLTLGACPEDSQPHRG